jgi:hypothetical protein
VVAGKRVLRRGMNENPDRRERRVGGERRKEPTRIFSKYALLGGRRRIVRRDGDRERHVLVDNYGLRLFVALLLLLMLSTLDAYLTLALLKAHRAEEMNPVMALYLKRGSVIFVLEKLLFTSIAVFILAALSRFVFAKISLALAIAVYLAIVFYELRVLNFFLR